MKLPKRVAANFCKITPVAQSLFDNIPMITPKAMKQIHLSNGVGLRNKANKQYPAGTANKYPPQSQML